MIKVYVAGAYSDDNVIGVLRNIGRGEYMSKILFMHGFAPFTPWFDKEFVISGWDENFDVRTFYDYSIEWLRVSDAVFVVPNFNGLKNWQDSSGTRAEIALATKLGIPVFFDIDELIKHFKTDD